MNCPDCDRPVATLDDYDATPEGTGSHLCWRTWYGDQCINQAVDWRTRALAAEVIAKAAHAWRHAICDSPDDCGDGWSYHGHDCHTNEAQRALVDAVDAAFKEAP